MPKFPFYSPRFSLFFWHKRKFCSTSHFWGKFWQFVVFDKFSLFAGFLTDFRGFGENCSKWAPGEAGGRSGEEAGDFAKIFQNKGFELRGFWGVLGDFGGKLPKVVKFDKFRKICRFGAFS